MIKCIINSNDTSITQVKLSGHANFKEYGSDIVCSAVSILMYTIADKLLIDNYQVEVDIKEEELGMMSIIIKEENQNVMLLMETLKHGLLMIQKEYPKYITVKEAKNA